MGRWEPDARGRLSEAAMALFTERGFEQTTVAEIAARAGLTERTFFRYFADKREVLFGGGERLQAEMVAAVRDAPAGATPMAAASAALDAAAAFLPEREQACRRHRVVAAHSELRERELIKMATLAGALGAALRARGVKEPTASLTAETVIAVFRVAFERWVAEKNRTGLRALIKDSLDELTAVTAAG